MEADACESVKDMACIRVMKNKGGKGCVREFIEEILK